MPPAALAAGVGRTSVGQIQACLLLRVVVFADIIFAGFGLEWPETTKLECIVSERVNKVCCQSSVNLGASGVSPVHVRSHRPA